MRGFSAMGAAAALLLAAGPVDAQPSHPLDGLTAAEFDAVREILAAAGHLDEATRLPLVTLAEPPKDVVRGWQSGDAIPRQALAVVRNGPETSEALIDLAAETVVSWQPAGGESMIMLEEFLGAMDLALAAPEMATGLAARGLTPDEVFCLPLTAGAFGLPEEAGRRLMRVPCYRLPEGSNFYAHPIEGLFAVVDLVGQEVLEVVDTGVVPVPSDPWGYTGPELAARFGGLRPEAADAGLAVPDAVNYAIDGGMVTWDMWRFHLRVDRRPGLVVSLVDARDGDRWRPVLYQAHLSEVFVPYMSPDAGWYWRTYMDSGEYGFGIFLSPLRPGVDCPAHARFLDATLSGDDGTPFTLPGVICVFERNIGDPAWRHYEIFAQTETEVVPAEGRPATELVVRAASEVGNYDYLMDYVFQQDGTIRIAVGSTGLDAVAGAASVSMHDETAAAETRYGTLIAPNLVAPNHDHYFNFRLDLDVDGVANDFMRARLVPNEGEPEALRRSFWTVEHEMPATDTLARSRINPAQPTMFHIANRNVESYLGHNPTYMLMPGGSYAYGQMLLADPPAVRNAYIDHQLWVTPFDPGERYAGGAYAFQSSGDDTLMTWTGNDRPIDNRDIVLWYTVGFHHVPRMEDWPVMPLHWSGFALMPFNFFGHNPAITIPPVD